MLSSTVGLLTGKLGRCSAHPDPRPRPAQTEPPGARQTDLVICDKTIERTFAWLGRCRRLAKDWEKTIASATAFLLIAHIRLLTRRIARLCPS